MKKLLLIPLLLSNALAQDGSFNGTVYDLDSGRIQVIRGSAEVEPYESPYLRSLKSSIAQLDKSIAKMEAERMANNQLEELRRQTRLLQQIADK